MDRELEILHANTLGTGDKIISGNAQSQETNSTNNDEELIFLEEIQNLETHANVTEGTDFKLKEPPDLEEILAIDKNSIPATSHNVSVINSACQQVLREMEFQLLTLLKKNRKEQEIVQHYIDSNGKSSEFESLKKPPLKIAGMPYFKDKHGFYPPPNEDVLRKKKKKKLLPIDFIQSFPIWNPTDGKKLAKAVSKYNCQKISEIDWMKISATDMEGKYSPSECKSKWMMNLNPEVNRCRWSLKENKSLQKIAAKYNYQDWDKIAEELGTKRTGLQCSIQYHTHKCPSEGKWTKEEDENLKRLVEKYKVKDYIPWTKVVWHFQHRSLKQCQERYLYHLGNIKRGAFTMEEDFVIVYLASKLKNFGEVAKFLPNRVATQVRARYEYLVQLSMPEFTKEEDKLLSRLMMRYPKNWAKISEHFKNRSKVQCRKRWGHLQRGIKLRNESDTDLGSEAEGDDSGDAHGGDNRRNSDASMVEKNLRVISKPVRASKAYPETYKKLIEHHQHCYKFLFGPRLRTSASKEEAEKALAKLKFITRTLSICDSPLGSDFDLSPLVNNCDFDVEDLSSLEDLKSEESCRQIVFSNKIIPPNFMTLVGLRTILMIWSKMKNFTHSCKAPPPMPTIDSNERNLCGDAKKLFKTRLKALFAFPLLLSNIDKPENPKVISKHKISKRKKPLSKLKKKRHAKYMSDAYRKKIEKSLCEKLSEPTSAEGSEEKPENARGRKRKSTRRSKGPENSDGSEGGSKKARRSSRTENGERPATETLTLYKLFTN